MRVLVVGGSGMLGHKLCQVLRMSFDVSATFRGLAPVLPDIYSGVRLIPNVDVLVESAVRDVVKSVRPDVIVNAVGLVKQRPESTSALRAILVNSLLPHRLVELCALSGSRLILVSTDCVFSGSRGNYLEQDLPDPVDLYGRSKLLGEIEDLGVLTIRTSMVGREIGRQSGLLEWFLSNSGRRVKGFARVVFSGLTTQHLAIVIGRILSDQWLHGIRHVSSPPISKFDFLVAVNTALGVNVVIDRDESAVCDRSLDSSRFWRESGLTQPTWPTMLDDLARDPTRYGPSAH